MNITKLKKIIKEEIKSTLKEAYQDKYKMIGLLITNIKQRTQQEIYSDIRSITGVTVISSREPIPYNEQDTTKFQSILTVKVDGYPFIKSGGFNRDKLQDIISQIIKVEGVSSFNVPTDKITPM